MLGDRRNKDVVPMTIVSKPIAVDSKDPRFATDKSLATLVAKASNGESSAWNELVGRYGKLIRVIARNHRLNEADAAEVAQITWMKLVERIGHIERPDRVNAWIATTARRECLRVLRASGRTCPMPVDDLPSISSSSDDAPEAGPIAEERNAALRLAYSQLSPRCRMMLSLMTGDAPFSYEKLSVVMNMKIGSIGPTRGRCLERLRQIAAEYGVRAP